MLQKRQLAEDDEREVLMTAAVGAAEIVRKAEHRGFQKAGRSMVASDVINGLQDVAKEELA
jgi:hypothetical protein